MWCLWAAPVHGRDGMGIGWEWQLHPSTDYTIRVCAPARTQTEAQTDARTAGPGGALTRRNVPRAHAQSRAHEEAWPARRPGDTASKAPADARMRALTPSLRRGGAGGIGHGAAHAHGVGRWRGRGGRGARGGAGAVRRPRQCVCEALTGSKWRRRLLCEEGKRVPGGERAGG